MSVQITSSTSYMRLDCWVLANIIQLATMNFCRRFLNKQNDPCGRQFDQMTQAARSVTANIAEGTSRHDTSIEIEMRLLDVARASNNELMGDFMFLLMDKELAAWSENHPLWQEVYEMRLAVPRYGKDLLQNATKHVRLEKLRFDHLIENEDFEVVANSILALCTRVRVILTKRLESILADFEQNGGFTENMTDTRLKARQKTNAAEGAPRCPECGAVMIRRMAKKGSRSGHEFWRCSNHTIMGCEGLIDIEDFNKIDYNQEGRVVQLPAGSFEEILTRFRLFVIKHQRFPFMDGSPDEASLRKWHREVSHGLIQITEKQKQMFDLLATELLDVPKHRAKE